MQTLKKRAAWLILAGMLLMAASAAAQDCPLNYDPVCGTDGFTYNNECFARAAGVSIAFPSECPLMRSSETRWTLQDVEGTNGVVITGFFIVLDDHETKEIIEWDIVSSSVVNNRDCWEFSRPYKKGMDSTATFSRSGLSPGNEGGQRVIFTSGIGPGVAELSIEVKGLLPFYPPNPADPTAQVFLQAGVNSSSYEDRSPFCRVYMNRGVLGGESLCGGVQCGLDEVCVNCGIAIEPECRSTTDCDETGPVCGCDGLVYPSECAAFDAGVDTAGDNSGQAILEPACASDGTTYSNECTALAAGATIVERGETVFEKVCGADGLVYTKCEALALGVEIIANGPCPLPIDLVGRLRPGSVYGDPVDLSTGAYLHVAELIAPRGPLLPFSFALSYSSMRGTVAGSAGRKWIHNYEWRIEELGETDVRVRLSNGEAAYFERNGTEFLPKPGVFSTLERNDESWTFTTKDQLVYSFELSGRLSTITDRNGNAVVLTHDQLGRLVSAQDPSGRIGRFSYDGHNRIRLVDYAGLQRATLSYDDAGCLAMLTLPNDKTIGFTSDERCNLLTATAAGVLRVTNAYDENNRIVTQRDASEGETRFSYEQIGDEVVVTVEDRLTRKYISVFDRNGRRTVSTDPEDNSWSFNYDANGNQTGISDPLENSVGKSYDRSGNLTGVTTPSGSEMLFGYDFRNNLTSLREPNGQRTQLSYDVNGNLTGVVDPLGNITSFGRDTAGRMTSQGDRNGHVTNFGYSATGDLASIEDPLGRMTTFKCDDLGRVTVIEDKRGHQSRLEYDSAGILIASIDALERRTEYEYDALGRLTEVIAPGGRVMSFVQGSAGETTSQSDALGNTSHFEHDDEGHLTAKSDPLGNRTDYHYGENAKITRVVDALGGVTQASYDAVGNRVTLTDPRGHLTRFEHDFLGRVVEETDPLDGSHQTSYDSRGLVSSITNARGDRTSYEYDDEQRLVQINLPNDTAITQTLDDEGNPVASEHDGAVTVRSYDALNRLIRLQDEMANEISYGYDEVGNLGRITYTGGKTVRYAYDELNRLTRVIDWADRVTTYGYGLAGDVVRVELPDGSTVTSEFDAAGRLTGRSDTSATGSTIFQGQYTLDAAGNTIRANTQLPLDPVLPPSTRVFVYDEANRLTRVDDQAYRSDADGNLILGMIAGRQTTLAYNSMNQLVAFGAEKYRYDARGMRIEVSRGGTTVRYVWDMTAATPRVLEEHDGAGRVIARYVYGVGLISREGDNYSVYHFDKRGSTVALTDIGGTITDRYAYGPYGEIVAREGSTANPFTYNGRDGVIDGQNGLYFMRARDYIPSLMRFAQEDSSTRGSLLQPSALNRYAYVNGNPIDRIDPNGEFGFISAIGGAIGGAVIGAGAQMIENAIAGKPAFDDVLGAAVGGAVAGAAAGFGGPLVGQMLGAAALGGLGGGIEDLINAGIKGETVDWGEAGKGALSGFLMGGISKGVGSKLANKFKKPDLIANRIPGLPAFPVLKKSSIFGTRFGPGGVTLQSQLIKTGLKSGEAIGNGVAQVQTGQDVIDLLYDWVRSANNPIAMQLRAAYLQTVLQSKSLAN